MEEDSDYKGKYSFLLTILNDLDDILLVVSNGICLSLEALINVSFRERWDLNSLMTRKLLFTSSILKDESYRQVRKLRVTC